MALSKDKRAAIKEKLLTGIEYQIIADEQRVSVKTVARLKKELAEENPDAALLISENKHNIRWHARQEKLFSRVEREKAMFEDREEGWIYHMTAEEIRHKQGGKWWSFIAYPESAPEDWIDRLRMTGCEIALSPLHDKDVWGHDSPEVVDEKTGEIIEEAGAHYKSGQRKKAHVHGIIKFEKSQSYLVANELIRNITNGPYAQKCLSLKGQFEYFIHLNHPEKYQYEKSEIQRFNGFVIEPTQADKMVMIDEIGRVIAEHGFIDLNEVRAYYEGQYEYINVVALKAFYFEKLTQVNYRRNHPEGRVQRVRLVDKKEK